MRGATRLRTVLQAYVDEILHWRWDPIGVAGAPRARDEYDSYVPAVVRLLENDASPEEIACHLAHVSGTCMGVGGSVAANLELAEILIDYRDWVREQVQQNLT